MPDSDLLTDPLLEKAPVHEGYKVLGGIVLYQKLGVGGMGVVYRGRHLRLNIDVAVKVMSPPPNLTPDLADQFVKRFLREAQVAAMINHQNLVRVIDVRSESGVYFLVMDYVDGESAGERLKRKGKLSEEEAVEIALGAADGLAEAHRKGIVHRDVKPDNILINKEGRVHVADLGLAKAVSGDTDVSNLASLTRTRGAMGTPEYMPLEQFESARDVGPTADVWALGVTLFKLLTDELPWGQHSFLGLIAAMQSEAPRDVKEVRPDLSDGVRGVVRKAMEQAPEKRYADCAEMADALADHLDAMGSPGTSVLSDEEAGSTRFALVTMTPPASRTMTLISKSFVDATAARDTGPVPVAERPGSARVGTAPTLTAGVPRWVLPAVGVGVVFVALVVALLVFAGGSREPSSTEGIEAEAASFYEEQLEAMTAELFANVVKAIDQSGSGFERTTYSGRIIKLREKAAARLAELEEKRLKEAGARERAEFEQAVSAADEAEGKGNLEAAARHLERALGLRKDAAVAARLKQLRLRTAFERLMAGARAREEAGKLKDARTGYREALAAAPDAKARQVAQSRLDAVEKRIRTEEAVAAVAAKVEAKDWRAAWKLIGEAREAGIADPRLDVFARQAAKELAPPKKLTGPLGIELVLIPGGTFVMGSDSGLKDERPAHKVTVSSFYIGKYEVTKAQSDAFTRKSRTAPKTRYTRDTQPAVGVSWNEAMEFCRYLASLDPSGAKYRLPTEAEWEYAARGKQGRTYPWGNEEPGQKHANLKGRADGHEFLAPVGSFPKGVTPEGVMDMIGNAAEWCQDWYQDHYPAGAQADPRGPAKGTNRVARGGAYEFETKLARAAVRGTRSPERPSELIGFRAVRELTAEEKTFERTARGE